jgi:hypothetical protein
MSVATRKSIPPVVRFEVFQRDNFRCIYCGATKEETKLVVDHVIPVRDGGANDMGNLATACQPCNAGKGARSVVAAEAGDSVGRTRSRLADKWLGTLATKFPSLRTATEPVESTIPYADTDNEEGETVIRFMPNYIAVAPRYGGWRGEELMVSIFPLRPEGEYPIEEQVEIRNAVIAGYETDNLILLGRPERFIGFCVNYRYKGNPLGYLLDGDLLPESDYWFPGWYPDECLDFADLRSGELHPLCSFNREGKTYGV